MIARELTAEESSGDPLHRRMRWLSIVYIQADDGRWPPRFFTSCGSPVFTLESSSAIRFNRPIAYIGFEDFSELSPTFARSAAY